MDGFRSHTSGGLSGPFLHHSCSINSALRHPIMLFPFPLIFDLSSEILRHHEKCPTQDFRVKRRRDWNRRSDSSRCMKTRCHLKEETRLATFHTHCIRVRIYHHFVRKSVYFFHIYVFFFIIPALLPGTFPVFLLNIFLSRILYICLVHDPSI